MLISILVTVYVWAVVVALLNYELLSVRMASFTIDDMLLKVFRRINIS